MSSRRWIGMETDASPDQARARLAEALGDTPGVRGRVGRRAAFLYQRRGFPNPFQTRLRLSFKPRRQVQAQAEDAATVLKGVSDIGLGGRVACVAAVAVIVVVSLVLRHQRGGEMDVYFWPIAAAMAFAFGAVYAAGRELARKEHDVLVRFLIEGLDARVEEEFPRKARSSK